jgi:hypothetical protein
LSTDGARNIPDYVEFLFGGGDDAPVGFELTLTYRQNPQAERVMLTSFEMSYRRSKGNSQEGYTWFRTEFDPYSIHPWRATSHLLPGKLEIDLAEHLGVRCPNGFLPEIAEGPMYSQSEQDGGDQKHPNGIRELCRSDEIEPFRGGADWADVLDAFKEADYFSFEYQPAMLISSATLSSVPIVALARLQKSVSMRKAVTALTSQAVLLISSDRITRSC